MRHDPLHNLLKQADADAGPAPRPVPDLPQRVYRRHRRRRAAQAGTVGAMLLCVALGSIVLQQSSTRPIADARPDRQEQEPPEPQVRTAQNAMLAWDANADLHARTAKMLTANERRRASLEKSRLILAGDDPADMVRQEKHAFALTRISDADRLRDHPDRAEEARRIYRQTIELFPDTPAADIAAKRLDHLKT